MKRIARLLLQWCPGILVLSVSAQCLALEAPSPDTVAGPRWYLGGGIAHLGLRNDHPAIGNHSGIGPQLLIGSSLGGHWKIEGSVATARVAVDETCDPAAPATCATLYYPADDAEYAGIRISIRRDLPVAGQNRWLPWVSLGYGYYYYKWETYFYSVSGSGPTVGAGVDLRLEGAWLLRLDINHSTYAGADEYSYGGFGGSATQAGIALVYGFR